MKAFRIVLCIGVLACSCVAQDAKPAKAHPVRNQKTAMRIGRAELVRTFGAGILEAERPFTVKLENGIWSVVGTQYCQENLPSPNFYCQGGHWVRISASDGHIIGVGGQGQQ